MGAGGCVVGWSVQAAVVTARLRKQRIQSAGLVLLFAVLYSTPHPILTATVQPRAISNLN